LSLELSKRLLLKSLDQIPKNAVWFHTASIGEFVSSRFIIDHISSKYPVFITYFSPRSKDFFSKINYPSMPLPLDLPFLWDKLIKTTKPHCLINVEKEFWPFLIRTNIPKMLINARTPKNAFEKLMISYFDSILAKDEKSFRLLKALNKNTIMCGNLKLSLDVGYYEQKDSIVVGSTHPQEEQVLIDTIKWILNSTNYRIFLAPRHIKRVKEVSELLRKNNIDFRLRTEKEEARVVVLDTMGELKNFYKKALVSIVGGSFVKGYGGHNIVEPVSVGSYVLYGVYVEKIEDIANVLETMGLGFRVNKENIIDTLKSCLENPLDDKRLLDLKTYIESIKNCYLSHVEQFVKSV
jgi:3-deoxy-D-manno-octulosonic-acid transferase